MSAIYNGRVTVNRRLGKEAPVVLVGMESNLMAHPLPRIARPQPSRRKSTKNPVIHVNRWRRALRLLTTRCVTTKGGGWINPVGLLLIGFFCLAAILILCFVNPSLPIASTGTAIIWRAILRLWK